MPGASAPATWRDLDVASRQREYSPSSCIGGDYRPFIEAYAQRSAAARLRFPGRLDLRYGPRQAQRLDLFVPPGPSVNAAAQLPPLLLFIHGGYWQELSKDESAFAAADCLDQGLAYAALDYPLAPHATVAEMVAQCGAAVAWLHANAAALGFDARRIVVAGSSAGAHLAAMTALADVAASLKAGACDAPCVRAAVLVSGIYELEPLLGTSINEALGLTLESALELSPALCALRGFPPSIVCWGAVETLEFKRQSRHFAAQLERARVSCQAFEVAQRNHFDIVLDLADPRTRLGRAVAALIRTV
ncbi:MAG: alpha/beta hydrolase [Burkholderiaceae bacterium]